MTTPLDLDALERMRADATPGELVYDEKAQHYASNQRIESADCCATDIPDRPVASLFITAWRPHGKRGARPNARYLAALWNAAPALLSLARSAESWKRRAEEAEAEVYKAHSDLSADGGVSEHECECAICVHQRGSVHVDHASDGRCDVCPKPGHFHGEACWALQEIRDAAALRPPGDGGDKASGGGAGEEAKHG